MIRTGGEHIELLGGDVVESRDVGLEVLRQYLLRHVLKPVGELNTTKSVVRSRDEAKCWWNLTEKVESSLKAPVSKTSRNSAPSLVAFVAWHTQRYSSAFDKQRAILPEESGGCRQGNTKDRQGPVTR